MPRTYVRSVAHGYCEAVIVTSSSSTYKQRGSKRTC